MPMFYASKIHINIQTQFIYFDTISTSGLKQLMTELTFRLISVPNELDRFDWIYPMVSKPVGNFFVSCYVYVYVYVYVSICNNAKPLVARNMNRIDFLPHHLIDKLPFVGYS